MNITAYCKQSFVPNSSCIENWHLNISPTCPAFGGNPPIFFSDLRIPWFPAPERHRSEAFGFPLELVLLARIGLRGVRSRPIISGMSTLPKSSRSLESDTKSSFGAWNDAHLIMSGGDHQQYFSF
jgi:hypothetical protein